MNIQKKQILLSNDDGIDSPGLWAAAEALTELGYVTVSAPRDHMSATGRGHQRDSDGSITPRKLTIKDQEWDVDVYAIGGSPSQSVAHGVLGLAQQKTDLVVSGINIGENFGTDVTYSGTVGAALEAASLGIPALAVSLQLTTDDWDRYPEDVDFSTAAYFTKYFAKILLENQLPDDVDVLNLVVPKDATPDTPWKITKLANTRYYKPYVEHKGDKALINAHPINHADIPPDSDMHTVLVEQKVSVVPISLDLTSRVEPSMLDKMLRK